MSQVKLVGFASNQLQAKKWTFLVGVGGQMTHLKKIEPLREEIIPKRLFVLTFKRQMSSNRRKHENEMHILQIVRHTRMEASSVKFVTKASRTSVVIGVARLTSF